MSAEGRRVSYDKFWGGMLLLTAALPYRLDGESYPWQLIARPGLAPVVKVWLAALPLAGLLALCVGVAGRRGRGRHLGNFLAGVLCVALPVVQPAIPAAFPDVDAAALPLGDVGSVGWVMCLALLAIYAGSGMRIVRPAQVPGLALGALGALVLGVFAFLPAEGSEASYALVRVLALRDIATRWRELLPFLLFAGAALVGTINLVRSSREVALAKLTRMMLVGGLLAWLALPFLVETASLEAHLPRAWGALHLLAPLFLALDGAIACLAVTITRSSE
jgi:hypothetical protein